MVDAQSDKNKKKEHPKAVITAAKVNELLGPQKYREQEKEKKNEVGATLGLAWTEVGGSILGTEAAIMEGRGKLTTTGKLGDVMQESAQAAMSYVRSRAHHFGLPRDFYRHLDIHLHVPEGAIPKDGPSAGITIATSITSALTSIPVRADIAMTGEITVRGRVLPIGGLKEKLLAAHRHGIREVLVPADNERDLADIPENIRKDMKLHFVSSMDEVLKLALEREIEMAPFAGMLTTAEIVERSREDKVTH
jgi:ATP-dependent Lon protease